MSRAEMVERMAEMQAEGLTYTQIGEMVGMSRAAVSGALFRRRRARSEPATIVAGRRERLRAEAAALRAQGLSMRRIAEAIGVHRVTVAGLLRGAEPARVPPPVRPARSRRRPVLVPSAPVPFSELRPAHCRYIVEGERRDALYCGAARREDSSYCAAHHAECHDSSAVTVPVG